MGRAKEILLAVIDAADARRVVERHHYTHKAVNNSQLHYGVFLRGRLEGALSFGPPLDQGKLSWLVRDTPPGGFVELNRLALSDELPRNSESRALAVAFRLLRRNAPCLQWVVSFANPFLSGDGAIYRAAGFVLTGMRPNSEFYRMPDGALAHRASFMPGGKGSAALKRRYGFREGESRGRFFRRLGAVKLRGCQLRYIYFLDPSARERLVVPEIPYSEVRPEVVGTPCAASIGSDVTGYQPGEGGASPTAALYRQLYLFLRTDEVSDAR